MATKILFFPQNETHLANMLPVVKQLEVHNVECFFLDASSIYHQNIYNDYPDLNLIKININTEKPYYLLKSFEKIRVTNRFIKEVKNLKKAFNGYVLSNDGSLQRAVLYKTRPQKSFYLLDAIINDNTFSFKDVIRFSPYRKEDIKDWIRRKFKLGLMRVTRYLPFNYYFPSEIGTILADKYFVMGDYVKNVLKSRGLSEENIEVTGLPRFREVFKVRHSGENLAPGKTFKILTLTQSAVWHNDHIKEEVQKKQIFKLIKIVEALREKLNLDIRLSIRLHPRDIVESRSYFFEKDFVTAAGGPLYPQLLDHDIVVATTSTVLVETLAMNGRVAAMFLENQWWRYKRSFLKLDCFPKFYSRESLKDYLEDIIKGMPYERRAIDQLISPLCLESDRLIAQRIKEILNNEAI